MLLTPLTCWSAQTLRIQELTMPATTLVIWLCARVRCWQGPSLVTGVFLLCRLLVYILGLTVINLSLPEWIMEFCKVVLTFESVYIILQSDHSNEISLAVFSHGTAYYAVKGSSNFWVYEVVTIQMKATEQYFPVVVLTFQCENRILQCDHSNEICWTVFSHRTTYSVHSSVFYVCGHNPKVWEIQAKPLQYFHMVLSLVYYFIKWDLEILLIFFYFGYRRQ